VRKEDKMTEKEKMISGKIYDPSDKELTQLRQNAHRLCTEYNVLPETDEKRGEVLKSLGLNGSAFYLQGPVQFDYGCFTTIGVNSYANFNFTCVDCCPVTIGDNVFMGPNVSLLTPMHPLRWQDRNQYAKPDGTMTDKEYAKPITIGNNCWIAGNVTVCGGVTIGDGCVIGAGSVVTRDIPPNSLAVGVPCRVIRGITEADSLENHPELF
jgi:maltose O-acetyltransferase